MDQERLRKFLADFGHIFVVYQIEKMQKRKTDPPTAVQQAETVFEDRALVTTDDDISSPLICKSEAVHQEVL